MKSFLILAFMIFTADAMAVCSSPISRTNNSPNTVLTSTKLNLDFNTAYTRLNELPGDCITAESITTTQIDDGTIVNADISASAAISLMKLAPFNSALSTATTLFSTSSTSLVDVTNLSVSITTVGRPVLMEVVSDGTTGCEVSVGSSIDSAYGDFSFFRGATEITSIKTGFSAGVNGTSFISTYVEAGSIRYMDLPAAGTHTYKLQTKANVGTTTIALNNCKLLVREL